MQKILVIEDDTNILDIVVFNLKAAGFSVDGYTDGAQGLAALLSGSFDLAILDVMLPGLSGLDVLTELRKRSGIPVIIMSAKDTEADKLTGFARMADDYITKPFSVSELVARVKAHLARSTGEMEQIGLVSAGNIKIDLDARRVFQKGMPLYLSEGELALLLLLAKNRGQVLSREEILKGVWGYGGYMGVRNVDVQIMRLRAKIEQDPSEPKIILSRRGKGYYFRG